MWTLFQDFVGNIDEVVSINIKGEEYIEPIVASSFKLEEKSAVVIDQMELF